MRFSANFLKYKRVSLLIVIGFAGLSATSHADSFTRFSGDCDLIQIKSSGKVMQTSKPFNLEYNDLSAQMNFVVDGNRYVVTASKQSELSPFEVAIGISSPDRPNFIVTSAFNRHPVVGTELDFSVGFRQTEYMQCSGDVNK